MMTWHGGAAVLGKVPWDDEYLTEARLSSELRAFADWVFRNAQRVGARLPEMHPLGEPSATYGYLMRLEQVGDPHRGIAGVVGQSADRCGRPYPLAVAASATFASDFDIYPYVAPIVLETYWQLAIEVLSAVRTAPVAVDDRRLQQLVEAPIESVESAHGLYAAWARRTGVFEFCTLLDRPLPWLARAIRVILAAVAPRGVVDPLNGVRAFRVPLGRAAGGALCFWLDVLGRAARSPTYIPSLFWSHDGRRGEALLCLSAPGDTTLATLWRADPPTSSAGACDLTVESALHRQAPTGIGPEDLMLIDKDSDSLWAMLERVGACTRPSSHGLGTRP